MQSLAMMTVFQSDTIDQLEADAAELRNRSDEKRLALYYACERLVKRARKVAPRTQGAKAIRALWGELVEILDPTEVEAHDLTLRFRKP